LSKILDLIVRVTDQASEQLKELQGTGGEKGSGVLGTGDAFLALATKVGLAAMATEKVVGFIDDNLNEWQEYVFTVDNLSKAFGMTYNETEQLVYIADLYNISNDALFSTLNKLAREGLGTGAEALNNLRSEFQDIEDPADRAQYLFGMAGEQGQKVLGPLMDMTDLEWADLIEGVEALDNVDEDMVDNARALEEATAEMTQQWTDLKIELANWSAPGVTSFLTAINNLLSGERMFPGEISSEGFFESYRSLRQSPYSERWEGTESDRASALRWNAIDDTLRNLPVDIADALERR